MTRKALSPVVATVIVVFAIALIAGVTLGYLLLNYPRSYLKGGHYAEVVGTSPQGSPLIRFIYFNTNDNSWGYCTQPPYLLRGAYQIQNRTFFYFYPSIELGNIIGRDASATQLMYQRGATCP